LRFAVRAHVERQLTSFQVRCLCDRGGWLHVHENVAEADEVTWLRQLEVQLEEMAGREGRGDWRARVAHVEHVKSYAPRVWHLVADVEMRPVA